MDVRLTASETAAMSLSRKVATAFFLLGLGVAGGCTTPPAQNA